MPTTTTRRASELAYTLLWSSLDDHGQPLDGRYSVVDFAPGTLARLEAEFDAFCDAADSALLAAFDAGTLPAWFDPAEHCLADLGPSHEAALEHDYILTRNHHGAGFWDGDWQTLGDTLTTLAQSLPELEPYVGDNGTVYICGMEP
jgi:hypothetical protein